MAYNVFKRPMFKRGGSTTGTGIMSHVEPKTIGGGTISGNNMFNNRTGFQAPILTIGEGMASELARGKPGFTSTPFAQYSSPIGPQNVSGPERFLSNLKRYGTRFPKTATAGIYGAGAGLGMGLGALTDFYAQSTKTPEEYRRLQEMSEFGIMDETNLDVGEAMKYIEEGGEIGKAPGFFPRGGKKKFFEDRNLDPETGLPLEGEKISDGALLLDELDTEELKKQKLLEDKPDPGKDKPAYEGTDIKSEVRKESEMLRELLKDDKYSKGEAALIIAGALAEPGSFSDKIKKATELAAPVARRTREEDKAITLAAYKLAKEKEQQQIKAGTLPKELMYLQEQARLLSKEKGTTQAEEYKNLILQDVNLDMATKRAVDTLLTPQGIGETNKLINTIKGARGRRAEAVSKGKDTAKIDKELEGYMSEFETLKNTKGFAIAFPQYMNFKEGGRVKRAIGSDEDGETSDIISSQVSFTPETTTKDSMTNETVVEKPVENLSFAELRDRLPPEITDDVVQMLASSEEALQDFAYIRTQQDINQFNVKYGVNLVIPPTQA
jgi:hypothetical protein